jgi:uncharacterized membrane protein YphA (DoxX/SURF4 family)
MHALSSEKLRPARSTPAWFWALIDAHVDPRPLAITRILVGLALIFGGLELMIYLDQVLAPNVVPMPYLPWLPRMPHAWVSWFTIVWCVSALCVAIGFLTRLSGTVLTLVIAYALLVDHQTYSNHLYLYALMAFLLTLADSGAAFSYDAWRAKRQDTIRRWPVLLICWMVSIVYIYAVACKINPEYLAGNVLKSFVVADGLALVPLAWQTSFLLVLSYATLITELFLAIALWFRRWRVAALVLGVLFHAALVFTGGRALGVPDIQLLLFAVVTVAPYAAFFCRPVAEHVPK